MDNAIEVINRLLKETRKFIVSEEDHSYVYDPYLNIIRSRVTAEVCKSMIRTSDNPEMIKRIIIWLSKKQNLDGSWDEEHPKYKRPSSLVTAIVAEALLLYDVKHQSFEHQSQLKKARDYILASELSPGFFKKSESYLADHLNVDATCGAFLAGYGSIYNDKDCIDGAQRAAINCVNNQTTDGAYPYTTTKGGSPYKYPFYLPCIHYQGVTIYHLYKIQKVIDDKKLQKSLENGIDWLSKTQHDDGRFDWSKSGLMFAYYLTGAYGFAASSYKLLSNNSRVNVTINQLNRNIPIIANRWERSPLYTLPFDIYTTYKTARIGKYPFDHRLFRFGYGLYRQYARRRYRDQIDERVFILLSSIMRIKASTIEPLANFPDLFMTSEILDCLSYAIVEKA